LVAFLDSSRNIDISASPGNDPLTSNDNWYRFAGLSGYHDRLIFTESDFLAVASRLGGFD